MRGWRVLAIVPLTVGVMAAGVVVALILVVVVPFSIAFHLLNARGER